MKLKAYNLPHAAKIFKALSDEARLRILHLIKVNEEMCGADLEHILGFTQAKTSRHITYLKNTDLLGYRKRDQWIYYYIREEYTSITAQMIKYIEKDVNLQEDLRTFRTLYANNELAIRKLHSLTGKYSLPEL